MSTSLFDGAEIISIYTRAQAIEDGILIDMTQEPFGTLAIGVGIKWPIAMTAAAYNSFVAIAESAGHVGQDVKGRWWDVVYMYRETRREITPFEVRWSIHVVDPDGRMREKELKCVSGPADNGELCLTFMLPNEV
jgi:uncharacterized protein DUF6573